MAARAPAKSNRSQRPKGLYQPPGLTAFVAEREQKDFFKYLYSQYTLWEKERKRCYYNARIVYRKKKNNRIKSFPSVTSASTPRHVTASVDADSNLDLPDWVLDLSFEDYSDPENPSVPDPPQDSFGDLTDPNFSDPDMAELASLLDKAHKSTSWRPQLSIGLPPEGSPPHGTLSDEDFTSYVPPDDDDDLAPEEDWPSSSSSFTTGLAVDPPSDPPAPASHPAAAISAVPSTTLTTEAPHYASSFLSASSAASRSASVSSATLPGDSVPTIPTPANVSISSSNAPLASLQRTSPIIGRVGKRRRKNNRRQSKIFTIF